MIRSDKVRKWEESSYSLAVFCESQSFFFSLNLTLFNSHVSVLNVETPGIFAKKKRGDSKKKYSNLNPQLINISDLKLGIYDYCKRELAWDLYVNARLHRRFLSSDSTQFLSRSELQF